MINQSADECVFCTLREQPAVLFETRSLFVMPDKFPTRPGHTLIIAKEHLACYADAPDVLEELEEAKGRVERFLMAMYPMDSVGGSAGGSAAGESGVNSGAGEPAIFAMEHGIYGQTVFHAYLHVTAGPYVTVPSEYAADPDVERISGWDRVVARYAERGQYRVMEYGGVRYLVDGPSPSLAIVRPWFTRFTGMTWKPEGGWRKYTSEADVRELERRWGVWTAGSGAAGAEMRGTEAAGSGQARLRSPAGC